MMLHGSLVIHGADLEKLARAAIRDSGLRLAWHREEELLAELVAFAWDLSERHDEHRYPGGFAKGCYTRLRFRITDWIRKTEGRTRWQFSAEGARTVGRRHMRTVEQNGRRSVVVEYERPALLSLDAPFGSNSDAELGETLEGRGVDVPGDCAAQSGWHVHTRHRIATQDEEEGSGGPP
jgi:hypothetical protein